MLDLTLGQLLGILAACVLACAGTWWRTRP